MSWTVGEVLRDLIPLFADYDKGTVETVDDVVEGTSFYITDTIFLGTRDDDAWNNGLVLLLNGTNQWACQKVSDYDSATAKLTVLGTDQPAVGDEFLVWKNTVFSLGQYIGAINQALRDMRVMCEDESLSVVDDQEDYSLPDGVSDVRIVELVDSDGNFVAEIRHWSESPEGQLQFKTYIPSTGTAATLRLKYVGQHALVDEISDTVTVNPARLLWEAATKLVMMQAKSGHQDEKLDVFWSGIEMNLRRARAKYKNHLAVKITAANF